MHQSVSNANLPIYPHLILISDQNTKKNCISLHEMHGNHFIYKCIINQLQREHKDWCKLQ